MHCFDCAEQNTERPAVATCSDCSAGVCAQHAYVDRRPVACRMTAGMVPVQQPTRQTARILRCPSCAQIHAAVATCEARAGRDC
ncbi:DUF2180 family protein [Allosaccharopolyspora coralli]|uniref:DUF2180 family protein n=1 Tax=Allosaccharopolyspora coralli TaxID=2665642 RepID=A0A5Q3Q5D3_9PSEU|nr:DUF2180 family protein [Allosaccharopolyspora coralli]QGK68696.1 DUF2180 family protein [Allosaccharopolyspora coralli]